MRCLTIFNPVSLPDWIIILLPCFRNILTFTARNLFSSPTTKTSPFELAAAEGIKLTFCNSGSFNFTVTKSPTLTAAAFSPTRRAKISRPVMPSPTAALERSIIAGIKAFKPVKYTFTATAFIPPLALAKLANCADEMRKDTSRAFGSISSPNRSLAFTKPPKTPVTLLRTPLNLAVTDISLNFRCTSTKLILLLTSPLFARLIRAIEFATACRLPNDDISAFEADSSAVSKADSVPTPLSSSDFCRLAAWMRNAN